MVEEGVEIGQHDALAPAYRAGVEVFVVDFVGYERVDDYGGEGCCESCCETGFIGFGWLCGWSEVAELVVCPVAFVVD
jgi:hypothetical protein